VAHRIRGRSNPGFVRVEPSCSRRVDEGIYFLEPGRESGSQIRHPDQAHTTRPIALWGIRYRVLLARTMQDGSRHSHVCGV
jgi:hypothetical protein